RLGAQRGAELGERVGLLLILALDLVLGLAFRRLVTPGSNCLGYLDVLDGRLLLGHGVCFFLLDAADHRSTQPKISNIAQPRPRSSKETYAIMIATNTSTTLV